MQPEPIKTHLRDGTPILIRPVEPEDKHLLEIGFEHLSDRSRYFRFLHPVAKISERELKNFATHADQDHVAYGVLDLSADQPEPIAIARYIRVPGKSDTAEFAVTVVDSHQGRGLGSLLFGTLAAFAVTNGVGIFICVVHIENTPMIKMLRELGAIRQHMESGVAEFLVTLHQDPMLFPDTPTGMSVRRAFELLDVQALFPSPAG